MRNENTLLSLAEVFFYFLVFLRVHRSGIPMFALGEKKVRLLNLRENTVHSGNIMEVAACRKNDLSNTKCLIPVEM